MLATDGVTGTLTLNADGTFATGSRVAVDMTRLRSDQSLRDTWIRLFGVETNKFKESLFVPERATGRSPCTGTATTTMHWSDFAPKKPQRQPDRFRRDLATR